MKISSSTITLLTRAPPMGIDRSLSHVIISFAPTDFPSRHVSLGPLSTSELRDRP